MLLTLKGITPLIMHNVRLADPDYEVTKLISALTAKGKNMTEADRLEVSRLKFLGGMYWDEKLGPHLPAANVFASMISAARKTRKGLDVESGVYWLTEKARLEYEGPRNPEEMWNGGESPFVDRRMVRVEKARIPTTRPIFPSWSAEFEIDFDDTVIKSFDALQEFARVAGRVGVGDYKRFYGKYRATITR